MSKRNNQINKKIPSTPAIQFTRPNTPPKSPSRLASALPPQDRSLLSVPLKSAPLKSASEKMPPRKNQNKNLNIKGGIYRKSKRRSFRKTKRSSKKTKRRSSRKI